MPGCMLRQHTRMAGWLGPDMSSGGSVAAATPQQLSATWPPCMGGAWVASRRHMAGPFRGAALQGRRRARL